MESCNSSEPMLVCADVRDVRYAVIEPATPRRPFALAELWEGLTQGRLRLKSSFQSDARVHAAVVRVEDPTRRRALSERHSKILKTWLQQGTSKHVAYDYGVSASGMTAILKSALLRLGVQTTPRGVPPLFLFVAHATPGRVQATACEHIGDEETQLLISVENLDPRQFALSRAERDILSRLVGGRSNRDLASERGVSPRTIANQLAHLFRKFRVSNRMELLITLTRLHMERLESRAALRRF